jgi:hypothetical protein
MTLFVTIEACPAQFIGAVVQFLSFRQCATRITYRLCIVARERHDAAPFVRAAADSGMHASTAAVDPLNPYLNKWSALDDYRGTPKATAILLDWDVFNSQRGELPVCGDSIAARRNPSDLYRHLLAISPTAREINSGPGVASSINGGVLVSSVDKLRECGARVKSLVKVLHAELSDLPPWQVEQFALSVAVGELGFVPLPNRWNVTPVSPVSDAEVAFFHYNDSVETTRRLKLNLQNRSVVSESLNALKSRWPAQVAQFGLLYAEAIDLPAVRALVEMEAAPC